MDKKIIWGVVGLLIIIAIGGFMFFANKPKNQLANSATEENTAEETQTTGSLRELLSGNKNVTCTFAYEDEQASQRGTVYVAGQRMRGNFMMRQPEAGEVSMSMIQDGEYAYVWGGPMGAKQGTKIKITQADADQQNGATAQNNNAVDLDQKVDFDCQPWVVNNAMFALPSDVTFTDVSAQIQQMQQNTQAMPKIDCSACDQAPAGPARDQCRQALGC